MILHQNATFTARMQKGTLVVTDRSPDLPAPSLTTLIGYLTLMAVGAGAVEHWKAASMSFDGLDLTVKMERCDLEDKRIPHYLVQTLSLAPPATDLPYISLIEQQKTLVKQFRESVNLTGWVELATSKPLGDLQGAFSIITIWMKY